MVCHRVIALNSWGAIKFLLSVSDDVQKYYTHALTKTKTIAEIFKTTAIILTEMETKKQNEYTLTRDVVKHNIIIIIVVPCNLDDVIRR